MHAPLFPASGRLGLRPEIDHLRNGLRNGLRPPPKGSPDNPTPYHNISMALARPSSFVPRSAEALTATPAAESSLVYPLGAQREN